MMQNHHLPLEILLSIISQVNDRETLSALCLTTKSLSNEAFKHLYSHIDGRDDGRLHLLLIGTLLRNPSLALLIRSYSIITISSVGYETEIDTDDDNPPQQLQDGDDDKEEGKEEKDNWDDWEQVAKSFSSEKYDYILWDLLPKALSLMSNLHHLSFTDIAQDTCAPHLLRGWKKYGYTFKLKTLKWKCGAERVEDVIDFLKGQEGLETLSIRLDSDSESEPLGLPQASSYAQRLVQLSGNLRTLLHFLPNRQSITRVQWFADFDDIDDGITSLRAEWGRITHLSMGASNGRQKLLLGVAKGLFDSLLALEIQQLYYEELETITTFPRLRLVVVTLGSEKDDSEDRLFKAKYLFQGSPSLVNIYTCVKSNESEDGMLDIEYERWKRSEGPVLLAWQSMTAPTLADFCTSSYDKRVKNR